MLNEDGDFSLMGTNLVTHAFPDFRHPRPSLTCRSGNCLLNCSGLTRAGRPEESSPCLRCGSTTRRAHVPGPHFSHCHYRCHCCCSWAAPPRNLLDKSDSLISCSRTETCHAHTDVNMVNSDKNSVLPQTNAKNFLKKISKEQ